MNDLASWANSSGIIVKDIEVRADPSKGRGLYATSAQWQLRVPASAFISNESIRLEINNHPILSSVTSAANNIVIYLAYHLVHSEGHGLQPYLNSLPRQSDSPTLWSREERELLTGSSLWFPLQAKLRSLHAVFEDLPAPVKSAFTFQDFQFADALFRSRSLDVPGTPGGVLVPFVDFVNHSEYPNCEWHAGEDGVSLVQTEPVDGELLISYGDKSAAEMLYSYGFIPSEYKHATQITAPLEMDREVLAQDAVIELKLAAFGKVPTITFDSQGWTSNFIWLAVMQVEDGLECTDEGGHYQLAFNGGEFNSHRDLPWILKGHANWHWYQYQANQMSQVVLENILTLMEERLSTLQEESGGNCTARAQLAERLLCLECLLCREVYQKIAAELQRFETSSSRQRGVT